MTVIPTGTVTFLFTDIEGSTKLAREHPEIWELAQARHHSILRTAIERHQGYVFQIIGDAFCAAFHTAADALRASIHAQQELQQEPWGETPVRVRMGIHTGEAEARGEEYHGYLTMSLVQRLMSAGHGGQILLSNTAENLLQGHLPAGVILRDMGEHKFKDVPHPTHVYQVLAPNLPWEFPALRTQSMHPNNLPAQLTSFVGREKELKDVKELLQHSHLLTLIGPGGTGKTRLSIQAASEMLHQFPDGVWLVELAPILDPLLVSRTTAIAIGLRDEPQRPVIDMLCDYLGERRMLLLLDNCEHLVDACAHMADRILHAATNVRIVASSREALGIGGEVTYRVPSLGVPDVSHLPPMESLSQYEAVKLFIDRATSAVSTFTVTNENAPALAQICNRLDGIPLAIELAAVKIRVLSLEQIAQRLDDRFRLLTGGSRTALERHQTLRAAIDWSYNYLPVQEQILFRRLSIFVGGWTLEAAESVCRGNPIESGEVLDLLEQLIHKSLVSKEEEHGNSRYRILETIRQYANEKMVESGESNTVRDRHLEYYLSLVETAEPHLIRPEQLEWLAQLDADFENIRSALEWSLNKESAEPSLRLCSALGWYWYIRSYWLEGTKWLTQALAKSGENSRSQNAVRVKALYEDAALANSLDDLGRMKRSAMQSLALAQEVSDRRDVAIARFYNGWALDREGNDQSILMMEQSLADFQAVHDVYWESVVYRWLGYALFRRGRLELEEKVLRHLDLAREAGERENLGEALLNRAFQLFDSNKVDEAEPYAAEAVVLFEQIGSRFNESADFSARLAWIKGDYKEAKDIFIQMKERFQLLGDQYFGSLIKASLGCLALEEGNSEHAQLYLEEALATARELGDKDSIGFRLAELGNAFYLAGKKAEFKQSYRKSISMGKELGMAQKKGILKLVLDPIHDQNPEDTARLLGAIANPERPVHPIWKRPYDRAEVHTRKVLGNELFESAFAEGQNMTLNDALDLALKTVERIE